MRRSSACCLTGRRRGCRLWTPSTAGLCRQLAYRILGNWQDAEECVNDAYLGAWNAIPPERPQVLSAYLCRIVRNQAVKICERRGALKRASAYTVAMEELAPFLAGPDTAETALEAGSWGC